MRPPKPLKAGIISLGCSKNLVDTEFIMGGLAGQGMVFVADKEEADLLLVNTCAFLREAVEESRDAIREALEVKELRPDVLVVVTGCLVNREEPPPDGFSGVALFLGPGEIPLLGK